MPNLSVTPDTAEAIDPIGVGALKVVSHLLPGHTIEAKYIEAKSGRPLCVSTQPHKKRAFQANSQLSHRPDWWREISLLADPRCSHFLHSGAKTPWPNEPSTEFNYALSIATDIAGLWQKGMPPDSPVEVIKSMRDALPDWIAAHLTAEHLASFGDYAVPGSLHDELASTVYAALKHMEGLVGSRVENENLAHGVLVAPKRGRRPSGVQSLYPDALTSLKRTPLLADGSESMLHILPDGSLFRLLSRRQINLEAGDKGAQGWPAKWRLAVKASREWSGIVLLLLDRGDLLVFALGEPVLVRRGGRWHGLLWTTVREALTRRYGRVGSTVFNAALAVSASPHGCILAVADRPPQKLEHKDNVSLARGRSTRRKTRGARRSAGGIPAEWLLHRMLPSSDIRHLGISHLAQLASIDGATVIRRDGHLLAYGAVIPSRGSKSEGARTAAARSLSKEAFVVKVSADGPITLFEDGRLLLEV